VTSPDSVGSASVQIEADLSKFAASLRAQIESAFKGIDFQKLVQDSLGGKPLKIPVKPEFDDSDLPTAPKQKSPQVPKDPDAPAKPQKVPVEVDPLFDAFRAELRRQTTALAKEVHATIPVDADTGGLRAEIGGQLAELAKQLKLPIPAEPGDKAAFQAKLQAQLDEVKSRVKAQVPVEADTHDIPEQIEETPVPKVKVEVDPLMAAFQSQVRSQVAALARTANANVPIGADTGAFRAELGAQLQAISHELKAEIPTEPADRAEYEAKLKAMVEAASARVEATVKTKPEGGSPDLSALSGLAGAITPNLLGGGAISAIGSLFQNLGDSVAKFAGEAAQGGSQLASSVASAAGPIGSIVGLLASAAAAVLALGAAATVLVPAFTAAAGAAAAIPAGLAGLGAAVGTLALGFKGISEAFKPKTGGAGGASAGQTAAQQARQVAAAGRQVEAARRGITAANRSYEASERSLAAAERGEVTAQRSLVDAEQAVTDAQKRAQQAQLAVNQARVDAANDLVDLNLQLRGSKISEEQAAEGLSDALPALNQARLTGNIPDIEKATTAYEAAQLQVDQAAQSTKELGQQTADANAKGVEGSDKVQSALQNQQDALEGVQKAQEGVLDAQNGIIDAADSLKSAQDGVASAADGIKSATDSLKSAQDSLAQSQQKTAAGAAAAAAQVTKLAPAAQSFVNALKALKPAFEDLRLDVQQRLFEGLDQTVTHLGDAWIPALKVTLGSYADTFNGFFKNLGASVSTPAFITDLQAGAEGARQGMEKVGDAITKSLVPAFGALSKAAGPFLAQLGGEIANVVTEFSNWVLAGQKTGGLTSFFDRASNALHDIFTTGKLVGAIVGDLVSIITGSQGTGKTSLDSFNDALAKIDTWLKDPKHQQQIRDLITDLQNAFVTFGQLAGKVDSALTAVSGGSGADGVGRTIGTALIAGLLAGIGEAMKASLTSFIAYFTPIGPLVLAIKDALGIHSPSTVFAEIGADLIEGLLSGIGTGFAALAQLPGEIFNLLVGPFTGSAAWLVAQGKNAVIGLINGIGAEVSALSTRATGLRTTVTNALSTSATWLTTHGKNAVIGLINGISSEFGALGTYAGNARVYVQNALVNAGSWLIAHGKAVVQGLINGIESELGALGSFLGSIGSFIQAHKGPLPKDQTLLVGAGQAIMGGLIGGISSQKDTLASELADVTSIVAGTRLPALGSDLDGVLTSSLQASSQQQILIGFKPGMTGDPILDALRQVIDVKHRGDPVAALSRS
jgi:phage-related protein